MVETEEQQNPSPPLDNIFLNVGVSFTLFLMQCPKMRRWKPSRRGNSVQTGNRAEDPVCQDEEVQGVTLFVSTGGVKGKAFSTDLRNAAILGHGMHY